MPPQYIPLSPQHTQTKSKRNAILMHCAIYCAIRDPFANQNRFFVSSEVRRSKFYGHSVSPTRCSFLILRSSISPLLGPSGRHQHLEKHFNSSTAIDTTMSSFLELPINTRVGIVSALILTVGLILGLSLDANAHIPDPWNRVSSIIGWIYFSCWSVSFYPQVFLNHSRKSVVGLSLDYTVLNFLGFTCYTIFNCAFYYSESVQEQYMRRNHGNRNAVEVNDVFFSIHAVLLVAVSLFQCTIYTRGGQTVGKATIAWTSGTVLVAILFGLGVLISGNNENSLLNTLNLLYLLSYVKLMTTLVKCIPQIVLNYQRKSTIGWTIWNVLLDIAGGLLSIGQQVLDSAATHDWTAITGDPVKFALGFVSIVVDIVFILQHYIWYTDNNNYIALGEKQSFLP